MNHLSWLLYLSDVCGNIATVLAVLGSGLTIMCFVLIIFIMVTVSDDYEEKVRQKFTGYLICIAPFAFIFLIVASACPSQNTMYAIAASEMGEQSSTGQKAAQALNAWLDLQISKEKQGGN